MRNTTLNSRQDLPGDAADLLVFPGALGNLTDSVTSGVARLVVLMSGEESIVKRVERLTGHRDARGIRPSNRLCRRAEIELQRLRRER